MTEKSSNKEKIQKSESDFVKNPRENITKHLPFCIISLRHIIGLYISNTSH